MHENNIPQEKALEFILGGNALFTCLNKNTQVRFTYKVVHDCDNEKQYKIYVLNGSDNTSNYKQIGYIDICRPFASAISVHTRDLPSFKQFEYIYLILVTDRIIPDLEIWHMGRCCKCGRVLTVPDSIERGIGPECFSKM